MKMFWLALFLPEIAFGVSNYGAVRQDAQGVEVIRLSDRERGIDVSIVPSAGNRAYEFKIHGKNILYFPASDVAEFKKNPKPPLNGIPFLAPWANRIPGGGFWAGDSRFLFNPESGSVRMDANGIAIHGMLTTSSLWQVVDVKADSKSASVTSRLDFWKYPELMANWPFAQQYEMTYRLAGGMLEVTTLVRNLSMRAMPLAVGFHPYFQLPGTPRSEWMVHVPARKHVETDSHLVATGELTDARLAGQVPLTERSFDDGFTDLVADNAGKVVFSVQAREQKIEVEYGPKYRVAVVFAPPGQNFICFEPMTAITNGINLAHAGKYRDLQSVEPGGVWRESFRVRGSGF